MPDLAQLVLLSVPLLAGMVAVAVTGHVLLHKEEPRAAMGWIALVWLSPAVGTILYLALGINRVRRRALQLRNSPALPLPVPPVPDQDLGRYAPLERAVARLTGSPLLPGNAVELLDSGDQAYPRMLAAIDSSERSIALGVYIFDRDDVGQQFAQALGRAVARGVEVRVLVDALGSRYSLPTIFSLLRSLDVEVARFLPARPWSVAFLNLRNHRKILVTDGRTAFTGGMNIRSHHVLSRPCARSTRDLMVQVEGPVVAQLLDVFTMDWAWTTGETLEGPVWFPEIDHVGHCWARAIPDGPDEDFDRARLTLISGLAAARHRVQIVTPYFLPDASLISALDAAALRGVEVDILLPEKSNLPYMTWATRAELPRVLAHGSRAWWVPAPFDHTKSMVVDDQWVLVGSANWDERSLRLNFELLLEIHDSQLAASAGAAALERRNRGRRITLSELSNAPLLHRLRDAATRLLKPYL